MSVMPYRDSLSSWAVVRLLPDMQRVVVGRFRKESDADGHLKVLSRLTPDAAFRVVFDVPSDITLNAKGQQSMNVKPGDLVRDQVPVLLRAGRQQCEAVPMVPDEYVSKLKDLLLKKAALAADALPDDFRAEVADLYDVLDALLVMYKIGHSAVEHQRLWTREMMGGFDQRLKLLWVDPA